MTNKPFVFSGFGDFWHYIRLLNQSQIDIIFHSLPADQQKGIQKSYKSGGWDDILKRNQIDKIVDTINNDKDFGFNLILIRQKVLLGKSVYMKKQQWDYVIQLLKKFDNNHTYYVLGGIKHEVVDDKTVLLVPSSKKRK